MLVCAQWGRTSVLRQSAPAETSVGAIDGAFLGLLGLLLAFAFAASASRFDERRKIAVDEANAISSAVLKFDLLPEPERTAAKTTMRDYIDARLEYGKKLSSGMAPEMEWRRTKDLQNALWRPLRVVIGKKPHAPIAIVLMPALCQVYDLAATRHLLTKTHAPFPVVGLIVALSLISAFIAGRAMATIRMHTVVYRNLYSLAIVRTVLVILDLDHPRLGLIRVDYTDLALLEIKADLSH